MTNQTAEQQLQKYRDKLGLDLGSEFHRCRQLLFEVSSQWDLYVTFFGHSERLSLLNSLNGYLAFQLERTLLHSVVLGISRLLDPVKSSGRQNLSLRVLKERIDISLAPALEAKLVLMDEIALPLKVIRNRVLAHNDYDHAIGNSDPLNFSSRREMTKVIGLICDYLNVIDLYYCGSTTILSPLGDRGGRSLLIAIHYAKLWREHRLKLSKNGDIDFRFENVLDWPSYISEGTEDFNRYKTD